MKTNLVLAAIINLVRGNRPMAEQYLRKMSAAAESAHHAAIARQLDEIANEVRLSIGKKVNAADVDDDAAEDELPTFATFLAAKPKRELATLILPAEVVRRVSDFIRGWRHREALEREGLPNASALLLYGPSGNGKTSLAEAIAESLGLLFLTARGEELIMSHIGESEKRIAECFESAKQQPCLAFFDEADSFACSRNIETGHSAAVAHVRAVNQVLIELERARRSESLFVFATNGPERLDPAFRRRMDSELELPGPDEHCRRLLIARLGEKWPRIAGGAWERAAAKAENMAGIERLALDAAREIVLAQCT